MTMHILVTRPKNQAARTASALQQLGHSCRIEPLLRIETIASPLPQTKYDGLLITSVNGLPMLDASWPHDQRSTIPLLSTGFTTAEAARNIGFANTQQVSGSALDLVGQVPIWMAQNGLSVSAQLLYPGAEALAQDVAGLLSKQAINVHHWVVYRAVPVSCFSEKTRSALKNGDFDGVLLYSKLTAHTFVQLMQQYEFSMTNLCAYVLSREILKTLPDDLKERAQCASEPSEFELLKLIGS